MKKLLIIIVAGCFISNSYAQLDDRREDLVFGLKAGANLSNVYDEQGEDFVADNKFGFAGGAFIGIPIGAYLGVQPEVLYSQKGFQGSGSVPLGGTYSFERTTSHLDIPIHFQFKPAKFLTILAGPQYSYLLQERSEFTYGDNVVVDEEQFENDNIRKNTLGFVAGLDLNFSSVILSARAGWDLQNNNGDGTSTNPNYKNHWLQFTLGYMF